VKLTFKVLLFLTVLGILSGGVIISLAWQSVNAIESRNLMEAAQARVMDLAEENIEGFKAQNETVLLPALQMTQRLGDADYVAALDLAGRVVAHTNVGEKGKTYQDVYTQRLISEKMAGSHIVKMGGETFVDAWAPVWNEEEDEVNEQFLLGETSGKHHLERLGTVIIRQSGASMIRTQKQIIKEMSLIVGCIGIATLILTLVLMRKILMPVRLLVDGTARIARGDYGMDVPVSSSDELGDLARSFNRMSKVLADTTVSKDYLSGVIDNLVDPLIITSTEAVIRGTNPAALQLLGYEREELIGKPLDIVCREHIAALRSPDNDERFRESILRNVEVNLFTKKGDAIPVLLSSSVLRESDKITGIIVTVKDMTERKRLEGIIRQSDKLSAVGQLAAGVAHEINNPLGVILGFAQAALRRVKAGEVLEMPLKSIEKEAIRCKELVQDLLTFSRVSKVEREPMDLNKTIEGALSLVSAQARMARVEVKKELASDLPRLLGNPNQIQQIVVNLANNAFDAMADQGILTVRTENLREGPLSWICLKMIDTGPGIPADVLPRIFEPFFTTKPVGKGTGLGLSLIHEIVKKHSGTIDVKSQPGCTEFCVKFPARLLQGVMFQNSAPPKP
jgi:PAS domain S-box-containing protein